MKTTLAISILVLTTSNLALAEGQVKRYFVESAKIDYEIKSAGNAMGMMKTKTIGKKRLIFNQYGANEITEENKIEKRTQGGKTTTIKSHQLKYMKGSMLYSVDFEKKRIIRMKNTAMAMAGLMGGKDMASTGEAMMKKMGGKKIGSDKVAGHSCDIWEVMGVKQCMYKGIPLRVETDMMGIKSVEIATKAEFDVKLGKDDFKLPDFPVYDMNEDMISAPKKLDKNQLDAMDKKVEKQTDKGADEVQKMLKMMAEAAIKVGIDKGKAPSEDQQKSMQQAMQGMMFPVIKRKTLAQAEMMEFAKGCFDAADTLKEVNKCAKKAAAKFPDGNDGEIGFDSWNAEVKKETMSEINQFLQAAPCIKKADNMQQLEKCMPDED
ncbi:MAG: hypothetical protein KAG34_07800 [Cocleimonas sp.]|nr:hypothetical protein [Cocleimonas sp.]